MEYITDVIDLIVKYLQLLGITGGFILIFLESIFPVLPLGLFIGFNVLAYGSVMGFIISYIATIAGCIVSFLLFRYVFKKAFYKLFKGRKLSEILKWVDKISNMKITTLTVILAMPFTPAFFINIAAGLTDIKFSKFIFSLLISKISVIYFWGYIGTSLIESVLNPVILIKITLAMVLAYIFSKIIQKLFPI